MSRQTFDYIVVGAGSAGSIVANRLVTGGNASVLLLEAGPRDNHWTIQMPGGLRAHYKLNSRHNWHFYTTAQAHLDNRQLYQPRGKVLGGSSSINGMVYLRGHPLDYDRWERQGAAGWSYDDVLPYFKRLETCKRGEDDYRGGSGPVTARRQEQLGPLQEAFLQAGREAGFPFTDDVNGARQEGFCRFDMNVDGGVRASTAHAYLRPLRSHPRLTVRTGVLGLRILFDGRRAVGFEFQGRAGPEQAFAEREVILSAGAYGSPQLLMLSGIGPADQLRKHDITLRADRPGVGSNLQDHLEAHVQHRCTQPVSLNGQLKLHRMALIGAEWFAFKTGIAARNQANTGAFLRTADTVAHPDIQFHFFPAYFDGWDPTPGVHGYRLGAGPMRPQSRGELILRSANPADTLDINPNYLDAESDRREICEGFLLARETLSQPAFAPFDGGEMHPGPDVRTNDQIDAYIRQTSGSAYHPSCTCKMGQPDDASSVVDPQGRVHGFENLRIADASIMPSIASSNLNAPTMMIGEKISDAILGLEAPGIPVHIASDQG